jgi:hypothetical protein
LHGFFHFLSPKRNQHAYFGILGTGIILGLPVSLKIPEMKNLMTLFMAIPLMMACVSISNAQNKIGVGDVYPGKVEFTAFSLTQDDKVKIEGMGGAYHHDGRMIVYYGWILDSETRKVVWHTADDIKRPDFDFGSFEINAEVPLNKGTYEVYFTSSFHNRYGDWNINTVGNFFDDVFGNRNKEKHTVEMQEGMGIEVSAKSLEKQSAAGLLEKKLSGAIVSIIKPDDNASVKKGFSLSGPTTLRIYAIGEGGDEETFDYAWIYDVDKRKRVWVMDYANTNFAGGADKNMAADEKITLPAGNYLVSYSTDDSHSYNNWNSMPPHDPQFSGITIWANSETDKKNIIPFKAAEAMQPILELTRVRDDDYVSKGLSVKSAGDFRVLCIGESTGDEMADYGWIMNAATREVVWDMNSVRTEHAGGAKKNQMVDAVIHLDKGDYIVYYVTDDSHSYHDWNAGPPHEQDSYGITLWATRKEDVTKVAAFEPGSYKSDKVVVEIVRVRDDENLSESFTLDRDTNLRIIALGEGVDGDMVDYGWIKNIETGKVVWEMTYRNTDAAGGASKNRMYNDTIILPKGSYKVYYETDGSHSYRNWNASPPRDPERYGISLMKEIN